MTSSGYNVRALIEVRFKLGDMPLTDAHIASAQLVEKLQPAMPGVGWMVTDIDIGRRQRPALERVHDAAAGDRAEGAGTHGRARPQEHPRGRAPYHDGPGGAGQPLDGDENAQRFADGATQPPASGQRPGITDERPGLTGEGKDDAQHRNLPGVRTPRAAVPGRPDWRALNALRIHALGQPQRPRRHQLLRQLPPTCRPRFSSSDGRGMIIIPLVLFLILPR